MIRYFAFLILLASYTHASGCIIDPYQATIMRSDQLKEQSDVIFFGKLVNLETSLEGKQVATFFVIKSFKGGLSGRVVVRNEVLSSCFRPFQTIDSAYYVFATESRSEGQYEITGSVSSGFVPLEWAVEQEWDFK